MKHSNGKFKYLLTALAIIAVAVLGTALAEPGGKDDPLVTVGYARQLASFQLRKVPTGQPLRLQSGAELVIVAPASKAVNAAGLTESTPLINLSSGERISITALRANQHYTFAGDAELTLRFDAPVTCLVRGELK
ncbi:MAG: hypothetical protein M3R04_08305 [bacterium]|nr:hypothetical protein [bacterium]